MDIAQLQNLIDAEFEKAQSTGKRGLSFLTNVLEQRVESIAAKQFELKNVFQSLDVQITRVEEIHLSRQRKNRLSSSEVGSYKHLPIVIDDDEEVPVDVPAFLASTPTSPVTTQLSIVPSNTSSVVSSRTSPVVSRTSPVVSQTLPVVSQTSPVVSRTSPVVSRTSPVVSRTSSVVSRISPVVSRASTVVSRTSPVSSRTSPVSTQASTVWTRTSTVDTRTYPVITAISSVGSNKVSDVLVSLPEAVKTTDSTHQHLTDDNIRRRSLILEHPTIPPEGSEEITLPIDDVREVPEIPEKSSQEETCSTKTVADLEVFDKRHCPAKTVSSSTTLDVVQSNQVEDLNLLTASIEKDKESQHPAPLANVTSKYMSQSEAPQSSKGIISWLNTRPHSPSDYKLGSRVLGKRSSDIWFPGEIIKTITDKNGQVRYNVKYDKGKNGLLSHNHVCPEEPATTLDLSVGSRVVALYGVLDLWYAGIVAEVACAANKQRVLVFFDDGFAQYLPLKKIHKVHHKGQNVWDDVTKDSRDFIQEYLEDFPSRPMLHVKVGQWIRTEWKGDWWRAKVLSVDGSLVKMLFEVDRRSEWIYRGSTRLDPLYQALVNGEQQQSKKARKLTRGRPSKKGVPFIEYNISPPCYGISTYSKTDPKGIQQRQLKEQREITSKQQQNEESHKEELKLRLRKSGDKSWLAVHEKASSIKSPVIEPSTSDEKLQKDVSSLPPEVQNKAIMIEDEPVVESTYSCIQASTMRKRTGASLLNNEIFKFECSRQISTSGKFFSKQQTPYKQNPNQQTTHQQTPNQQTTHQQTPNQQTTHQQTPNQQTTHQQTPNQQTTHQQTPNQQTTHQQTPNQQTTHHQTPNQQTKHQQTPNQQITHQQAPNQKTTHQQAPNQKTTQQQTPNQQITHQQTPNQQTTHQQTPNQQTTHQQTPNQQSTHQQTPNQQTTHQPTPNQQTTHQQPPNRQTTHQQTPNQQITHQQTPNQQTTHQQTPNVETTHQQTPNQQRTHQQTSNQQTTHQQTPNQQTTHQQTPIQQTTHQQTPSQQAANHQTLILPIAKQQTPILQTTKQNADNQQTPIQPTLKQKATNEQIPIKTVVCKASPVPNTQWKAPWLKNRKKRGASSGGDVPKTGTSAQTTKVGDAASILKQKLEEKLINSQKKLADSEISSFETTALSSGPVSHNCSFSCSRRNSKFSIDPLLHNPLALPILYDWKRDEVKRRGKSDKREVYYRAPCNRRLRNMKEVLMYLQLTGVTNLNVDHFTFDWRVQTDDNVPPVTVVEDVSNGQENRPLPAVNEVDGTRPPNIQYMSKRQFAPEVKLATEPGFMVCCDCTDNCEDATKCACIQLTKQGCKAMGMDDEDRMTYKYRKLRDCVQTGIYECNSNCSCSTNCLNRVVQNGIKIRLQIFKTKNRGWGLRTTDDIPAGSFVCTYAGYILNEELANQDGRKYGDEYMAELDYIEVAEKAKEGYESDISDMEEDDNLIDDLLQSDDNISHSGNSATDVRIYMDENAESEEEIVELSIDNEKSKVLKKGNCPRSSYDDFGIKDIEKNDTTDTGGKDAPFEVEASKTTNVPVNSSATSLKHDSAGKQDNTVCANTNVPKLLSANDLQRLAAYQPKSLEPPVLTKRGTVLQETIEKLKMRVEPKEPLLERSEFVADNEDAYYIDKVKDNDESESTTSCNSSSRTQSASSRSSSPSFELTSTIKSNSETYDSEKRGCSSLKHPRLKTDFVSEAPTAKLLKTRSLFGEEHCYVIDATFGNCGRFLNHSCSPNLFVQNVFVDTHDVRFPWVAFFAQTNIKAGSELTWDYMYEVGSVSNKSLYCLCGSTICRGRLL